MDQDELLKFGNELEISGVLFANGQESRLMIFPEANEPKALRITKLTTEGWEELLNQLDTLGVRGLDKTILRKSQRQIETNVSWNVFRRDNYTCQYCGKNDVPLTVDHIVLWEKLGASSEDNLISACRKCNKTRGNESFEKWLINSYLTHAIAKWKVNAEEYAQHITYLSDMNKKAKAVPLRAGQRNR